MAVAIRFVDGGLNGAKRSAQRIEVSTEIPTRADAGPRVTGCFFTTRD